MGSEMCIRDRSVKETRGSFRLATMLRARSETFLDGTEGLVLKPLSRSASDRFSLLAQKACVWIPGQISRLLEAYGSTHEWSGRWGGIGALS